MSGLSWFGGVLRVYTSEDNQVGAEHHNLTLREAQEVMNRNYSDRKLYGIYTPSPIRVEAE